MTETPKLHILFNIEIDELRDEPSGNLRLTYDPSNKRVLRLLRLYKKNYCTSILNNQQTNKFKSKHTSCQNQLKFNRRTLYNKL